MSPSSQAGVSDFGIPFMIPLTAPNIGDIERQYLNQCIDDGFVSSIGPFVDRLEAELRAFTGFAGAVATSAGTAGLHATLAALGVGRDGLVLMPTYTFIGTANAVSQMGADPFLVDVRESDWTMDPNRVEAVLQDCSPTELGLIHQPTDRPIQAIMPVCTLGWAPDLPALGNLAKRFDLPLVLDAAAAIGAKLRGRPLSQYGLTAAVYSFNGNKTVTAGAGGAVVGNDIALMETIGHLTTTAKTGADYTHDARGFNYRMSNIQAAVGCAQMTRLDRFLARKRAIFGAYSKALETCRRASPLPCPNAEDSACWLGGLLLGNRAPPRKTVIDAFRSDGISAGAFWKPIHFMEPYADCPRTQTPVAESIWDRVVILPCSTNLSDGELELVVNALGDLLR